MRSIEAVKILPIVYGMAVVAFLATPFTVLSQDIAATQLRWTSASTVDLKTGDPSSYNSVFISRPGEIQWLQKNGQSVKRFTVTGTDGSWTDISVHGTITFQVKEGAIAGIISFAKSGSTTTVTLDFTSQNADAIKRRFNISSVQIEN